MCLLFCQFCDRLVNIVHLKNKKAFYKCVDLIVNVFGKNSETSVFEGGRVTMIVHVIQRGGQHRMVVGWGQNF